MSGNMQQAIQYVLGTRFETIPLPRITKGEQTSTGEIRVTVNGKGLDLSVAEQTSLQTEFARLEKSSALGGSILNWTGQ